MREARTPSQCNGSQTESPPEQRSSRAPVRWRGNIPPPLCPSKLSSATRADGQPQLVAALTGPYPTIRVARGTAHRASKLATDAYGEAGRGPGDQGPAGSRGPGVGTLAAAEGRARPEGPLPFPPGENPILICLAGEAT